LSVRSGNTHPRLAILLTIAVLAVPVALPDTAAAQDSHYWTLQYGNDARLLGGAVVGSVDGVSAVFYNPGALALVVNPEFLLTSNVVQYTKISFRRERIDDEAVSSTHFGGVPPLFAGEIPLSVAHSRRLAYSFLQRHSSGLRLQSSSDISSLFPWETELAVSSLYVDSSMNDYWTGLSWARLLGSKVGFGISLYGSARTQRSRSERMVQLQRDGRAGVSLVRSDYDFWEFSLLAKIGIAAELDPLRVGLTITTPYLAILNSGSSRYDETRVDQDLDGDDTSASLLISDFQTDVPVEFKSPASVGFGAAYRLGDTRIHATVEWFDGIHRYKVLATDDAVSPDSSVTRDISLTDERESVINAGIGVEHEFKEALHGYASFRTDFSSVSGVPENEFSYAVWDIYHVAAGAKFSAINIDFTLGLVYAYGRDDLPIELVPLPDDNAAELPGDLAILDVTYRRITGVLGFTFEF